MKKWIGPFLSLLLILGLVSILGFYQDSQRATEKKNGGQIVLTQHRGGGEKKGEKDTFMIDLLKQLEQTVDGWLKSLNERIEREDVTHFEVRFLEILRSILEWVREKIDSMIESSEEEMPEQRERGRLQETHQRVSPFSEVG